MTLVNDTECRGGSKLAPIRRTTEPLEIIPDKSIDGGPGVGKRVGDAEGIVED
jgi:hypothetical protein